MDEAPRPKERTNLLTGQPFVKAALDPDLIPGVYLFCDQWCMYCPVTRRCLAYRCQPPEATEQNPEDFYANIAERMYESMRLVQKLMAAEGRTIPELDALLSNDPRNLLAIPVVNDSLERMARHYASVSSRLSRLGREVEARFPGARAFVRAGLDTLPDCGRNR